MKKAIMMAGLLSLTLMTGAYATAPTGTTNFLYVSNRVMPNEEGLCSGGNNCDPALKIDVYGQDSKNGNKIDECWNSVTLQPYSSGDAPMVLRWGNLQNGSSNYQWDCVTIDHVNITPQSNFYVTTPTTISGANLTPPTGMSGMYVTVTQDPANPPSVQGTGNILTTETAVPAELK